MGKAKNRWLKTSGVTNVDAILERAEADRKAGTRAAQAEERWPPSWSGGYYESRPRSSAALAGREEASPTPVPARSHKPHNPVTSSRERRAAAKKKSRTSNNQKPAGKKS